MVLGLFGGRTPDHPLATERSAQQALAELPKTNPEKALEDVHDWIVSVAATEELKPERRAEIYLLLDETAVPFHRKLTRDYVADANLPRSQEARLRRVVSEFWKELAGAYIACVEQCAADSSLAGRLKARWPLLCVRALRALAGQLKWHYMRNEPEGADLWQAVGKVCRFAEEKKVFAEMIPFLPGGQQTSSAERELMKLLMLAGSSPDSLSPHSLELADWIVAHVSGGFVFSATHQPQVTYNYIALGSGTPPQRLIQMPPASPDLRFFAPGNASGELDKIIRIVETGAPPSGLNLGGAYETTTVLDVCLRLKSAWASPPPVRKHERYPVSHNLNVATGFATVLARLQGEEAAAGTEKWVTENISAGGVGAVVSNVQGDGPQVGKLLALSVAGGSGNYSVGVIRRWNRRPRMQSGVSIRTFAKAAFPVRFGGITPQDAILLADDRNLGEEVLVCLCAGGYDRRVPPVFDFDGQKILLTPVGIVESGDDYEIARYKVMRSSD